VENLFHHLDLAPWLSVVGFVSVAVVILVVHGYKYGKAQLLPDHTRGVPDHHSMGYLKDFFSQNVQLVQNVKQVMDDVQTLKNVINRLQTENINLKQGIADLSSKLAREGRFESKVDIVNLFSFVQNHNIHIY
jgi:hypothetical protein